MGEFVRVPLEGKGTILSEAPVPGGGPVKASGLSDSVRDTAEAKPDELRLL
ncbi:hypothetical protein I3F58_10675 [Streptomyces sp. MUM 203J]|uniref:hypothetical protein n=1 Tax=Streptomyces sp. MUM 203J TaxID=2791990 RepID=UPI001F03859E|nr:hypothetical protein [Streptomyces sp. MUM 203J]MCH0540021.1 hypothetical protein [Streptomyces sp. MUM 203J]